MTQRDREEEPGTQRKRIAVACGRCRQRKIRCSGDNGTGGPCTNCKNAGTEMCQFLRVSSEELHNMKGRGYNYNISGSRKYSGRSPAVSPIVQTSSLYGEHDLTPATAIAHGSTHNELAYNYNTKLGTHLSGWHSPYGEQSIDYPEHPMSSIHESVYVPEQYCSDPGSASRQSSLLYMNAAASYGYGNEQSASAIDERVPLAVGSSNGSATNGLPTFTNSTIGGGAQPLAAASGRPAPYSVGSFLNSDSMVPMFRRSSNVANSQYDDNMGHSDAVCQNFALSGSHPASIESPWDSKANLYTTTASGELSTRRDISLRPTLPRQNCSYQYADPFTQRSAPQGHTALASNGIQHYPSQSPGRHIQYLGENVLNNPLSHGPGGSNSATNRSISGAGLRS